MTRKKQKGFTLVEALVAMFVLGVVMSSVAMIFSRTIQTYRNIKLLQRNIEDAQYAMNLMAKTLRTSEIISSTSTKIVAYDYSQDDVANGIDGSCVVYNFNTATGNIEYASKLTDIAGKIDCETSIGALSNLTANNVSSAQFVASSSGAGFVTISTTVCPDADCSAGDDKVNLETTVSLRNFTEGT